MNKRVLTGMFALFMAMAPWSGYAAQTIDSPHLDLGINGPTENCIYCHDKPELKTESCDYCHKQKNGPFGSKEDPITHEITTTAPEVKAHTITVAVDPVTHVATDEPLECAACHNPHLANHLTAEVVTGSYTGATFTIPDPLVIPPRETEALGETTITVSDVSPPLNAKWDEKTKSSNPILPSYRGMILWVADGLEKASYEVVDVDVAASTITVKGNLTVTSPTSGTFSLSRGQLIAKNVTTELGKNYREGNLAVEFPPQGSSSFFVQTGAGANGICQVCHTTKLDANGVAVPIKYWTSAGGGKTHNANSECTECHLHRAGFKVTGCYACHKGSDELHDADGEPLVGGLVGGNPSINLGPSGLADAGVTQLAYDSNTRQTLSGSLTAGQHKTHASSTDYNYDCEVCHVGTGMDLANQDDIAYQDGIQIGFSTKFTATGAKNFEGYTTSYNGQSNVVYTGNNNTTVTNTGAVGGDNLKCSNVYCHSDGTAVRRGCATATSNQSQSWDWVTSTTTGDPQQDSVKCNNCHGFQKNGNNPMLSGSHSMHVNDYGYSCSYCHPDTVAPSGNTVVISNKANHVNGVYDVRGDFNIDTTHYTFTYTKATRNCTTACHMARAWTVTDTGTCPDVCATGGTNGGPVLNDDPVVNFTATQVSRNTIEFTEATVDPDRIDPVKQNCLTYNSQTGHAGQNGTLTVQKGAGVLGKLVKSPAMDGSVSKYLWVVSDPAQYETDAVLGTVVKYKSLHLDNDPQSGANFAAKTWLGGKTVNGKIVDPLHDGYINGRNAANLYFSIPWNMNIDESRINVLATPYLTPTVVKNADGSYTLTLTPHITDPDALDPAKTALFGGNGHNKAIRARIRTFWVSGAIYQNHFAWLDSTEEVGTENANGDPTVLQHTYTGVGPGTQLWYQVNVWDAHAMDSTAYAAYPSSFSTTGWVYVIAP